MRITRILQRKTTQFIKAYRSWSFAHKNGIPGLEFAHFGRQIGWKLLYSGQVNMGLTYILAPLITVRYFEFPFALACLPNKLGDCLDVGSPRLFSLYVAL